MQKAVSPVPIPPRTLPVLPVISAFTLHAADHGYRVTEPLIPDGKIHRVSWSPQSKNKSGWYVAWDHGDWGTVAWGDWKDSWQEVWTSKSQRQMSTADRAAVKARVDEVKAIEAAERAKAMKVAEFWADRIWKDAAIDPVAHPYLAKKQIPGKSLRIWERDGKLELLVPLRDEHGSLSNLQRILEDGTKRFIRGAGIVGLHWRTGRLPDDVEFTGDLIVAEGVATAATVHKLSGSTVFAAMNAGNLPAVVSWVRKTWPIARILIAADDDRWERDGTARPEEKNMGRKKAAEAAANTRALIILPTFTDLQSRGTDWNDLFCEEGEIGAMVKWRSSLAIAALDRQISILTDSEYAQRRASLIAAYANAGAARMGTRQLDQRRQERRGDAPEAGHEPGERPPHVVMAGICEEITLWQDQFGIPYATLPHNGVTLNAQIQGAFFQDWLRVQWDAAESIVIPPNKMVLTSVVEQHAARARLNAPFMHSHYRFGFDPATNTHWWDLGRTDWQMVKIHADGWQIATNCPIKFAHSETQSDLPLPAKNPEMNGMDPLWEILNIAEEDRCLIAGFLLGAMLSTAPCFGLGVYGAQGTAKSITSATIRRILDPSPAPAQTLNDRNIDELGLTCIQQHIPIFENMSYVSTEVSDVLCSLTTGLSARTRQLYTNTGIVSYTVRRPWIINGINNVCSRGDLAQRSIPVSLLPAPEGDARKREAWLEEKFLACRPHIMAMLLDAAVEAIHNAEAARAFLSKEGFHHRMADALEWITAGESTLGFPAGSFIRRLNELQEDAGHQSLDGNPVLDAIESLLGSRGYWKGTMKEILQTMWDADASTKRDKHLPQTHSAMGGWVTRNIEQLKKSFGISVTPLGKIYVNRKQIYVREFTRITQPTTDDDPDFN